MPNALCFRLLLIFALLYAQLGGLTHGISHALAEQNSPQSLEHHCEQCDFYAQIDSAIGSSDLALAISKNCNSPYLPRYYSYHSNLYTAYTARAPPVPE